MKEKRGNKESQETKRKLVVDYLKREQGTHAEAAKLYQLSKSAVDKIWLRYKANGKAGLANKKRGVKGGKKINGKQSAEIRLLIKNKYAYPHDCHKGCPIATNTLSTRLNPKYLLLSL